MSFLPFRSSWGIIWGIKRSLKTPYIYKSVETAALNSNGQWRYSEKEIRQVLGHSNVHTTKIYLRERHGFSVSYDIMQRFHQVK